MKKSEHLVSKNPATEEILETFEPANPDTIRNAAVSSDAAFESWRRTPLKERVAALKRLSAVLTKNIDRYAKIITLEMGKTLKESESEVKKCVACCDYYAEHAESFLKDQKIPLKDSDYEAWITYQPLGVVLAIMPWNFPFWQAFRCAVPSITAGNTVILKHASNVSRSALEIEHAFQDAEYPAGCFKTLLASRDSISELIKNPSVKAVSLTGSTDAGCKVAEVAGHELKKCVLELGGSDPYIVLGDADIDLAAKLCAESRLLNAGQSCIAAKRFIVVQSVYESFLQKFKAALASKTMGDPTSPATDIGPMAREDLRDALQKQVTASVNLGAKCVLGGQIPNKKGYFYPPTILIDVKKGMPAYDEELFGPVASVILAKDETEALTIANDTAFGLGGGIFTRDVERGTMLIREELHAGFCALNDYVRSDPALPFGGIKGSGYGRELSKFGIHEFVNIKTLKIRMT